MNLNVILHRIGACSKGRNWGEDKNPFIAWKTCYAAYAATADGAADAAGAAADATATAAADGAADGVKTNTLRQAAAIVRRHIPWVEFKKALANNPYLTQPSLISEAF